MKKENKNILFWIMMLLNAVILGFIIGWFCGYEWGFDVVWKTFMYFT